MAKFLVTGAAGFIGSNLTEFLLNQGHEVTGLDNFSEGFKENLDFVKNIENIDRFKLIEGDIRNLSTCKSACLGIDFVLHQAALGSVPISIEQPLLYHENNITGTVNMLEAAKEAKIQRFVFASSAAVYGDTPTTPKIETMEPKPKSPYAIGKLTTEFYAKLYFELYGLPTVGLRYFNVFGPRQNPNSQYAAVIPKFILCGLQKKSPSIFGDGNQTRDFVFVDDVVKAIVASCFAAEKSFGKVINIGSGYPTSLNELISKVLHLTKSNAKPTYFPMRAGDIRESLADTTLSKDLLSMETRIELEVGLKKTIDFFHTN